MRFKKWLDEQTTTGAIALNLAKGGGKGPGVDVIGADCPDGQKWDKKKGKCVESRLSESKFLTLAHELMKIKDRKVLDRWYNELAKLPDFKTLNDTEKKTLMKKIKAKEKELK